MNTILKIMLASILLFSCKRNENLYYDSDLEIVDLLHQNNKTYFIFDMVIGSSLNWPEFAICKYNEDSSRVKIFIKKYRVMLEKREPIENSNIKLFRELPEIVLNYNDKSDSLKKSMLYVIILPGSVKSVKLQN